MEITTPEHDSLRLLFPCFQGNDIIRPNRLTDFIIAYKLYQEKYPNETKAPQTLFMVGFIQANELGQLDEAKATYTKFIELYTESDMVESAKSEIETIGLSPDEILKNKTIK